LSRYKIEFAVFFPLFYFLEEKKYSCDYVLQIEEQISQSRNLIFIESFSQMELNLLRKISASTQSFSFSVVLSQFRQYSMGAYFLPKIPNFP